MKKIIFLILITFISLNCYSQINYEKGYFINNDNIKTDCFIRNVDWRNNPSEIQYKYTVSGENHIATISTIKEFRVASLIYKRFSIQIDDSSQLIEDLTSIRSPKYKTDTLFLKQVVKGDANLYQYIKGNFETYFFTKNNENPVQLIHKKYLKSKYQIGENNMFKQQLQNFLVCESLPLNIFENLSYSKNNLSKIFTKYNLCKNTDYINELKIEKKNSININIRLGTSINSFKVPSRGITNPSTNEFDFGTFLGYQIGFESEFILGFNKNKWSVIVEPTYNYFQSETSALNYVTEDVTLTYKTFELPIGLRHYFFLNDQSKLFINASYVFIFDLNSELTSSQGIGFEFTKGTNQSIGLGYKLHDTYSIEIRYDTDRGQFFPKNSFKGIMTTYSIILGIKLF